MFGAVAVWHQAAAGLRKGISDGASHSVSYCCSQGFGQLQAWGQRRQTQIVWTWFVVAAGLAARQGAAVACPGRAWPWKADAAASQHGGSLQWHALADPNYYCAVLQIGHQSAAGWGRTPVLGAALCWRFPSSSSELRALVCGE